MSKVVLNDSLYATFDELDAVVTDANNRKIALLFDALGIRMAVVDFERVLQWNLILVVVADRQMAVQLNKLVAYVPNLKFVVDKQHDLFSVLQGQKGKRVWKER